ncbi:hypothetical protein [Thalassotalea ganghwensis]
MFLFFFTVFFTQAKAVEQQELPPLDPRYNGTHGMVLFTHNSNVYAYHLPLYEMPHNVQLLYKIDTKELPLLQLVRDAQLVTIKPELFNLQRLMRGEKMVLNADIYMGHFERDGMLVHQQKPLNFAKQLYVRELTDLDESNNVQKYDVVNIRGTERIYIHQIQQAPSFDHVIHIDIEAGCLSTFRTSSPVPNVNELQYKFINCGTMKPLYFETSDFNAKKSAL